ncbi:MAG: winged helix-turn-helix transcriptional regulator [Nitrososphaerales archaeon]
MTLKDLHGEGSIERRVVVSSPNQKYYTLSKKGKTLARALSEGKDVIERRNDAIED